MMRSAAALRVAFGHAFSSSRGGRLRRRRCFHFGSSRLVVAPEVAEATRRGRPVVALESTIVAHGMPWPRNAEVASEVEAVVRAHGAIPATIAARGGRIRVGLTAGEVAALGRAGHEGRCAKLTTRDLASFLANAPADAWGATTVASTMLAARAAGVDVFATGGTGGVHRTSAGEGEHDDVSADLTELSRTPVIVVSAGVKSVLDVGRTLERLETLSVPVTVWRSDAVPTFYSPGSAARWPAPSRADAAEEVARAYACGRYDLGLRAGTLVAVPNDEPAEGVDEAVERALREADGRGIRGKDVTPFLLRRVNELTQGDSLRSNVALVKRNAAVAAEIAVAVAEETRRRRRRHDDDDDDDDGGGSSFVVSSSIPPPASSSSVTNTSTTTTSTSTSPCRVVVFGGAVRDLVARPTSALLPRTSNPGTCAASDGGVGRNVAEVLGRLGNTAPILVSAVGDDARGEGLRRRLETECGVRALLRVVPGLPTATYLAVLDEDGDLSTAVADTAVLDRATPPDASFYDRHPAVEHLVLDANPPLDVLIDAADAAIARGARVTLEPTSVPRARVAVSRDGALLRRLSFATPDEDEARAMAAALSADTDVDDLENAARSVVRRMRAPAHLVVTRGARGVLLASRPDDDATVTVTVTHLPPAKLVPTENATGAGDTLCGAFVDALVRGADVEDAVRAGMDAAVLSVSCADRAVSPDVGRTTMARERRTTSHLRT